MAQIRVTAESFKNFLILNINEGGVETGWGYK